MSRYEIISGMMEDPVNLACVMREILRIEKRSGGVIKILPPPIEVSDNRFLYPSFREFLRMKKVSNKMNPESLDYLADIFTTGNGIWYICLSDGSEIGPFDNLKKAKDEVTRLFTNSGFRCLERSPWDEEDSKNYPL